MSRNVNRLSAVLFDWAGTTIDHGSRAPAIVIRELFGRRGIEITTAQAREPMGMAKRAHLAAVAAMPEVAAAWTEQRGGPCSEADIDALYAEFLPMQKRILHEHSDVLEGIPEVVAACRRRSLRIGSTTGYTRELIEVIVPIARSQGYEADCVFGAEDAPQGRPAPYLLFEAAKALGVYPLWTTVAVDDTPVGIAAGRNAGCWTVGITRTGNGVGLSATEFAALPAEEARRLCEVAASQLQAAGAHFILESAADLLPVLDEIERRLQAGELPVG